MHMTYDKAKHWIRHISKMDKSDKICFFTGKERVQNHHVNSVWRLAKFNVSHPDISPEDYPIPLAPISKRYHMLIHQFQDEAGHPNHLTEKDVVYMWIWKEQLKAKQREIEEIFENSDWIYDYSELMDKQIEAIEHNVSIYEPNIDEDFLKEYFLEEVPQEIEV